MDIRFLPINHGDAVISREISLCFHIGFWCEFSPQAQRAIRKYAQQILEAFPAPVGDGMDQYRVNQPSMEDQSERTAAEIILLFELKPELQ